VSAQVEEYSRGYTDKSWTELMRLMSEVTDVYLTKFRELENAAPEGERDMAHSMVVHEAALNEFAHRELAGDSGNSLAAVISLLQWPIAPPV
ncbi:MAG TPA: hypothetical protein VKT22_09830, partial [Steroidobacteraceae bacterium]|nr:hypothetical protein [Steroidobacteraceae bacterium]